MISEIQKIKIDAMNEAQLRLTISVNFNNKELVSYCESRLERLKVDDALVEQTDFSDFGQM